MQVQDPDTNPGVLGSANSAPPDAPMVQAAPQPFVPDSSSPTAFASSMYKRGLDLGMGEHQAKLMAAQAALESRWGQSGLATNHNNLFGMKAGSSWDGPTANMATTEQDSGGNAYRTNASWRKYGSADEAITDYQKRLAAKWPGAATADNWDDAKAGLKFGQQGGYATDKNYGSKLDSVIAKIDPNFVPSANPLAYAGEDNGDSGDGASGAIAKALTGQASPNQVAGPGAGSSATSGNTGSKPSQPWGNLGDSLTRMGAALMMRDNPTAGQAMLTGLSKGNNFSDGGYKKLGNGQYVHQKINKETGEVTNEVVDKGSVPQDVIDNAEDTTDTDLKKARAQLLLAQATKAQQALTNGEPDLPKNGSALKQFGDNESQIGNIHNTITLGNNILDRIMNGGAELGLNEQGQAVLRHASNNPTADDLLLKDTQAFINQAGAARMNLERGNGSDKRLAQAMQQVAPNGATWSTLGQADSINRVLKTLEEGHNSYINRQGVFTGRYPKQLGGQMRIDNETGETTPYGEAYPKMQADILAASKKRQEALDEYKKKRTQGTPTQTKPTNPFM